MVFSVITVCYQAQKEIRQTIESVLSQSFHDFEYWIIDGKSSDRTVEIAKHFSDRFAGQGIPFHVISEKDSGIYNAMNKGIDHAAGDYIIFMNAGDRFRDERVLQNVAGIIGNSDVLYGNTVVCEAKMYKLLPKGKDERMPFCHQSVFVKSELMKRYRFDEQYRICADYDLFCRLYRDGAAYSQIEDCISIYLAGGVSARRWNRQSMERNEIRHKYGVIDEDTYLLRKEKIDKAILSEQDADKDGTPSVRFPVAFLRKMKIKYGHIQYLKKTGWSKKCP